MCKFLSHYGWRGADISNILDFENDWPDTKVIKLEENYRSTPVILNCANSVIQNNVYRKPKALWTSRDDDNNKVIVRETQSASKEAEYVGSQIRDLRENDKFDYNDFVVLYRTNAQSRNFEDVFRRANIPYKTVGSISFYARAEIKDILAYLGLINNPKDDLSFLRIINQPKRGIGAATIAKLQEYADFKGWSLYECVLDIENIPTLTKTIKNKFIGFRDLIEEIRKEIEGLDLDKQLNVIYEKTGYKKLLSNEKSVNGESKKENVEELISAAKQFSLSSEDNSITAFLEYAALSSSTEEFSSEGQVSLMTIHSAKGLEFPVVFLTGMEDDVFPSFMSRMNDDIEEERRLCYVGITRAQDRLFLTHAQRRMRNGEWMNQKPSIFIDELPEEYIDIQKEVYEGNDSRYSHESFKNESDNGLYKVSSIIVNDNDSIVSGDKVQSKAFGVGTVVQNNKGILKIAFPGLGIKDISADFVTKL